MKQIDWTIAAVKTVDGKSVYALTQHFSTKREAVRALESQRKEKTSITRTAHSYLFVGRD